MIEIYNYYHPVFISLCVPHLYSTKAMFLFLISPLGATLTSTRGNFYVLTFSICLKTQFFLREDPYSQQFGATIRAKIF